MNKNRPKNFQIEDPPVKIYMEPITTVRHRIKNLHSLRPQARNRNNSQRWIFQGIMGHCGTIYGKKSTGETINFRQHHNTWTPRIPVIIHNKTIRATTLHIHRGGHMKKYNVTKVTIAASCDGIEAI